jgi:hypothetical protein
LAVFALVTVAPTVRLDAQTLPTVGACLQALDLWAGQARGLTCTYEIPSHDQDGDAFSRTSVVTLAESGRDFEVVEVLVEDGGEPPREVMLHPYLDSRGLFYAQISNFVPGAPEQQFGSGDRSPFAQYRRRDGSIPTGIVPFDQYPRVKILNEGSIRLQWTQWESRRLPLLHCQHPQRGSYRVVLDPDVGLFPRAVFVEKRSGDIWSGDEVVPKGGSESR